jgi:sugar lactone lactonase YvrE
LDYRFSWRFALALTLVLFALPASVQAYTAAPGYTAHDYATGFPSASCCHWGPIGIAFDQSDNLYVIDSADHNLYRFQPGGGVASNDTRVSQTSISGDPRGLAITRDGRLYAARSVKGDVVELSAATGQVLRTVAKVPCATGIAVDPVSGDLFVTENRCNSEIWRISNFSSGPGTATVYANPTSYCCIDGIAFDADGTAYTEGAGHVLRVDGTTSGTPGAVHEIAFVPNADGVAFAAHALTDPLPFLVANRNDGIVTRVGLTSGSPSETNIFSGGSRGDFAAVDSQGCLYITQTSSIVRMTGPNGRCPLTPSTPGTPPPPGLVVDQLTPGSNTPCTHLHKIVLRVRQRGRIHLRSVVVYINGHRVRRLRGRRVTAPITLTHLPSGAFRVRIVGITKSGRKLTVRRSYRNCSPPPHCLDTRGFKFKIHQLGGRIVEVDAWINGRHVKHVRGFQITSIVLKRLPQRRFVVRIVTINASGHRNITVRTYRGCRKGKPHTIVPHHR